MLKKQAALWIAVRSGPQAHLSTYECMRMAIRFNYKMKWHVAQSP